MNLSKVTDSLVGLALVGTSFFSQPAKADLFCYPWENNCKPDGKFGGNPVGLPFASTRVPIFNVYLHNQTSRNIWVVVHFKYTEENPCQDCAVVQVVNRGTDWRTGYWQLKPGQKVLTDVSTDNKYIYFHAYDENRTTWGDGTILTVDGSKKSFSSANMGDNIGSYTQGFK